MKKMCFLAFFALCLLSAPTKVWGADYIYKCAPTKVTVTSQTSGYKLEIPIKVKRTNYTGSTIQERTLNIVFTSSQLEGTHSSLVNTQSGVLTTYFKDGTSYYYLNNSQPSQFIISKRGEHVYEIRECTLYFGDNTNSYVCNLSYNANTLSDESKVEPFVFVDRATDNNYLMKNITSVQVQYDDVSNQTQLKFNVQGVYYDNNTYKTYNYNYETTLLLNNTTFLTGDYAVGTEGATLDAQSKIYWPDQTNPATRFPLKDGTLLTITHVSAETYRLSGALCALKDPTSSSKPYFYNFGSTGLEFTCRINYTIPDNEDKTAFLSQIKESNADFDLTLGRTLSNEYYNTFCSPIAISADEISAIFGAGTDIRTLESSSYDAVQNQLTLTFSENSLTEIEAGKPYLIKPRKEVINPQFTNVATSRLTSTAQPVKTDNANFYGILEPYKLNASDPEFLFLAAGNELMWGDAGTLKGMRAYFKIKNISDIQQASMVPARMQFGSKTISTDLGKTNEAQGTIRTGKYMYNGHLVIVHNGKKYNL
ncbi:MAG: hypothetical protein MJZ55_02170 [Paludibacteraceae bacterium]|nr:hypothetical protein [Paludibacteraceae bacterium]